MKTTIEIIKMSLGDPVTIAILLVLVFFSLFAWGIIITKYLSLKSKQNANISFYKAFDHIKHFAEIENFAVKATECPLRNITDAVLKEAMNLSPFVSVETLQPRSEMLEDTMQREVEACRLEEDTKLSFLAMASNVSPFFGLFGTVWGIMQSFYEIGTHGSADLSVVAPGIAVALVTTVAGLLTAIPASIAYNYFVSRNNRQEILYYNFSSHLLGMFKRGDLQAIEKALSERETAGAR
ncbi:MAG: MotA/TolQ/ExbB proton channel family protein [Fibromonadaceae bacterium]|jgi:biopolymer transport protein TolQ|nr:MotA/TolQ/ExbB proton channel family protein [Fibromonadaceae bacterium]